MPCAMVGRVALREHTGEVWVVCVCVCRIRFNGATTALLTSTLMDRTGALEHVAPVSLEDADMPFPIHNSCNEKAAL